jgi:hypothetical protein
MAYRQENCNNILGVRTGIRPDDATAEAGARPWFSLRPEVCRHRRLWAGTLGDDAQPQPEVTNECPSVR